MLRLRRPARVVGRLVDETGLPMAGVIVYCRSGTTANTCLLGESTVSDGDGRFAFEERAPGPALVLTCGARRTVELSEGEVNEVLVSLTTEKARDAHKHKSLGTVPSRPTSGPK